MAKITDVKSAGRSGKVPFIEGETPNARHERRLKAAMNDVADVQSWCRRNGAELTIRNGGHHWTVSLVDGTAEWWPSSAKLVFDREYDKGIHVHDVEQLVKQLDLRRK